MISVLKEEPVAMSCVQWIWLLRHHVEISVLKYKNWDVKISYLTGPTTFREWYAGRTRGLWRLRMKYTFQYENIQCVYHVPAVKNLGRLLEAVRYPVWERQMRQCLAHFRYVELQSGRVSEL